VDVASIFFGVWLELDRRFGYSFINMADKEKQLSNDRLGDMLIAEDLITSEQLDQAVQCQVLFGGRLGINLLELGFIAEDQLRDLLEKKYGVDSIVREDFLDIPEKIINLLSRDKAEKHKAIPVKVTDDSLVIAMLDPLLESAIRDLTKSTGKSVRTCIALELDIYWALEKYYAVKRDARLINLDHWLEHQRNEKKTVQRVKEESPHSEPLLPDLGSITSIEGVPKDLSDFWDRVGRSGHPEHLLPRVFHDLEMAETRDEIAQIILDFSALSFKRSMLFVVNEDMLFGWDARGENVDNRVALAVMIPLSRRSMFKTVVETGAYFLGPVPNSAISRRFISALGTDRPKTVVLLPILISGKAISILYADMGDGARVKVLLPPVQRVLSKAGHAFERLILKEKASNPKPSENKS
jgi:type II secretion system (T2SS) protein E